MVKNMSPVVKGIQFNMESFNTRELQITEFLTSSAFRKEAKHSDVSIMMKSKQEIANLWKLSTKSSPQQFCSLSIKHQNPILIRDGIRAFPDEFYKFKTLPAALINKFGAEHYSLSGNFDFDGDINRSNKGI